MEPRSRQKLQRVPLPVVSIVGGELAQHLGRVGVAAHLPVEVVFVEGRRREVAEVLVDPVAHDPGDRAVVPPRLLPHLRQPRLGDVPVVAHVVVVPDHRGRDRREQPADDRVLPGLLVEPGVLLVVGHLLTGRGVGAAALADLFPGLERALVDVDLVAEEDQELGPVAVLAVDHLARQDPQGVELLALFVVVFGLDVGALVGEGDPTGAEADVDRFLSVEGPDHARWKVGVRFGPALLAVERDLVLVEAGGLETFDPDQRVMVLLDREGRLLATEDLDRAGGIGLDPDRRLGLADVSEQGSQDQLGHGATLPTRRFPKSSFG